MCSVEMTKLIKFKCRMRLPRTGTGWKVAVQQVESLNYSQAWLYASVTLALKRLRQKYCNLDKGWKKGRERRER